MKFIKKIAKAVAEQYDPDKEDRVNTLSKLIYVGLSKNRDTFQLDEFLSDKSVQKGDIKPASHHLLYLCALS